ncbi:MAG: TlpA family protein disulfide reductase [Bacteroidetes bacterium]|nr:TlpA family protein disulfide reductase [Bacteroidota bacterium]
MKNLTSYFTLYALLISAIFLLNCSNNKSQETEQINNPINGDSTSNQNNGNQGISGTEPFSELWYQLKIKKLTEQIDNERSKRPERLIKVRGTILNAAGKEVTLDKLGGESRFEPISTSIINEEGVFELEAQTNQPQIFQIRVDDGTKTQVIPLLSAGGNYELSANFDKWDAFAINSPEAYLMQRLWDILAHNADKVEEMLEYQNSIEDGTHMEKYLRDTAPMLNEQIEQEKFRSLNEFIENNKSSILAAEAAGRLELPKRIDYVKSVYERSLQLHPYSSYVKNLGQRIIWFEHLVNGNKAPDFTLPDLNGTNYALSDYKGKVVLVHVTTAYFNQARDFQIGLIPIYKRFNDLGFEIITICKDDTEEALRDIVEKDHLLWPIVSDLLGERSSIFNKYPAFDPPETYLIGKDGNFIDKFLSLEQIENKLEELLF